MPSGAARAAPAAPAALKVRPPCTIENVVDGLRHAVLEHREVVLGERRDEAAVAVAGDHVGGHRGDRRRGTSVARDGGGACCAATPSVASARPRTATLARAADVMGIPRLYEAAMEYLTACPARGRTRPRSPALSHAGRGTRRPGADRAATRGCVRLGAQAPCDEATVPASWCGVLPLYRRRRPRARRSARWSAAPGSTPGSSPICRRSTTDALVTPADQVYVRTAAPPRAVARSGDLDDRARSGRRSRRRRTCAPRRSPPRRGRWART